MAEVQTWISQLIDPDNTPIEVPSSNNHNGYSYQPTSPSGSYYQPAPPPGPPPPIPAGRPFSPTQSQAGGDAYITLALVNQTATQKGVNITYTAEQVGPPHQPTWTVICSSKPSFLCATMCPNLRCFSKRTGKR